MQSGERTQEGAARAKASRPGLGGGEEHQGPASLPGGAGGGVGRGAGKGLEQARSLNLVPLPWEATGGFKRDSDIIRLMLLKDLCGSCVPSCLFSTNSPGLAWLLGPSGCFKYLC